MKIAMVLLDDFDNNVLGRSFDKIVVRKILSPFLTMARLDYIIHPTFR